MDFVPEKGCFVTGETKKRKKGKEKEKPSSVLLTEHRDFHTFVMIFNFKMYCYGNTD